MTIDSSTCLFFLYICAIVNKAKKISNFELMEDIKKSDHNAFQVLYNRLWEKLYNIAFSMLNDKYIAQDITQDVWLSLWLRRKKIKNDNIEAFLIKAVRFKVYNEYRKSGYRDKIIKEFINSYRPSNNIDQIMEYKSTEKLILNSVENLPPKCKNVFILSRYEGLKNIEIANKLNISQRTVEKHISNALKLLKNQVTS